MKLEDAKIGDKVYFREHWSGMIENAVIEELCTTETGEKCWKVTGKYGTTWKRPNDCYPTHKACLAAIQTKDKEDVETYKQNLHSIEDVLNFALNHAIANAEEYTDWNARQAFIERARELGYNVTDN